MSAFGTKRTCDNHCHSTALGPTTRSAIPKAMRSTSSTPQHSDNTPPTLGPPDHDQGLARTVCGFHTLYRPAGGPGEFWEQPRLPHSCPNLAQPFDVSEDQLLQDHTVQAYEVRTQADPIHAPFAQPHIPRSTPTRRGWGLLVSNSATIGARH